MKSFTRRPSFGSKKGFTLLEIVVGLLLLGIIAVIAVLTYNAVIGTSTSATAKAGFNTVLRDARAIAQAGGSSTVTAGNIATAAAESGTGTMQIVVTGTAPLVTTTSVSKIGFVGTNAAGPVYTGTLRQMVNGQSCTAVVSFTDPANPSIPDPTCV